MPEDFSHEDRMQAGTQVMAVLDYLDDPQVEQAIRDVQEALGVMNEHLSALGCDQRTAAQLVMSTLFRAYLPE